MGNMTAKRWFYLMLSLPITLPIILGLIGHLLYIVLPPQHEQWFIEGNVAYHVHASDGSKSISKVNMGNTWLQQALGYVFAADFMLGPLDIPSILLKKYIEPYLAFVGCLVIWSWHQPVARIRKILWWLPFISYPFLMVWLAILGQNGAPFMTPLGMHIRLFPYYCAFAYSYMLIAWLIVPKKYKKGV